MFFVIDQNKFLYSLIIEPTYVTYSSFQRQGANKLAR